MSTDSTHALATKRLVFGHLTVSRDVAVGTQKTGDLQFPSSDSKKNGVPGGC